MRDAFDLPAYFDRIGYDGPAEPTLAVLRRLHLLHPQAIPFENLSPYTGARVELGLDAVARKLVAARRGGYCFEHNKLFHAALVALGFHVTPLIARVMWQQASDAPAAQSHMLLRVDLDGEVWFADVGFGSVTQTQPLRHRPDEAQDTLHGAFRLTESGAPGEWRSEFLTASGWSPIYRFVLRPVEWIDYEVGNWYTSTHPESFFLRELIVCRVLPEGSANLFNDLLTVRGPDGVARAARLPDAQAWAACVRERFGLTLDGFDVDALFARARARGDALAAAGGDGARA
ncbi:arylamine N-acetyltransferase [Burkholderia sp. FERM BP-3421]|jgi:N-hydroxyarylamine O-acetyltransferase|uniref:arylamine N-acetyltransferase family protein n=1 Tax=Burkholderia sp. FERM BP-3421 TaxID=1494466 RepID=UPI0023630584|nr:arylamine N-acetyltransferase [Burkholderia sp. FERM BP-3421]WDD91980.1 arylamine N-acetyltransferase [Burkholderia sp. FERM BP-3421]